MLGSTPVSSSYFVSSAFVRDNYIVLHYHRRQQMSLRRFSLVHDRAKDDWKLVNNETSRTVERFDTKGVATAGGVLSDAIGQQGGSVRIHLENGRIQEERTYPRSADPTSSKG
jgi:hypothetical protein